MIKKLTLALILGIGGGLVAILLLILFDFVSGILQIKSEVAEKVFYAVVFGTVIVMVEDTFKKIISTWK